MPVSSEDLQSFSADLKEVLNCELNKPIFNFEITTTQACNCKCSYCFEPDVPFVHRPRLNPAISGTAVEGIKKLLDDPWFTSTFKGINLTFWGGEPTINPQGMWPFVAAFAGRSNVHWHIYTNGTRPDVLEELVTRLEVQRALKRLSVQISYDGKPVHDKHRLMRTGEPTSEQALTTARMLASRGVNVGFKATITPPDFKHMPEIWESYRELCLEFNVHRDADRRIQWCPTIDQAKDYGEDFTEDFKAACAAIMVKEKRFYEKNDYFVLQWVGSSPNTCPHGYSMTCMDTSGFLYTCHGVMYFLEGNREHNDEEITHITSPDFIEALHKKHQADDEDHQKGVEALSETCQNCVATHCAVCNACSAAISTKSTPTLRWYDRTAQPYLCKYYKIFGAYDRALMAEFTGMGSLKVGG